MLVYYIQGTCISSEGVDLAIAALATAFLPHDDTPNAFEKDPILRKKRSNNEIRCE